MLASSCKRGINYRPNSSKLRYIFGVTSTSDHSAHKSLLSYCFVRLSAYEKPSYSLGDRV